MLNPNKLNIKVKFNTVVGVIFLLLLVIVFLPEITSGIKKLEPENPAKTESQNTKFLPDFTSSSIQKITLSRAGDGIVFSKAGGTWFVTTDRADQILVNMLLSGLSSMEMLETASVNPANHEELGVSDMSGYVLSLDSQDKTLSLFIGKRGVLPGTYYVRTTESDETFLVRANLPAMSLDINSWRDTTIVDISGKDLSKVVVGNGSGAVTYTSENGNWEQIVSIFSPLKGTRFLNESEVDEFDNSAKDRISLAFSDGSTTELYYISQEGLYWFSTGQDYLSVLTQNVAPLFSN